jgi:outer membrane lipoprotein-sorting protein
MKGTTWMAVALAGALLGPSAQAADDYAALKTEGAQVLLAAADKRQNDYPTQKWVFKMTLLPPDGGAPRSMKFSVWQKQRTKRLVRFLEPGEVKGMSVLNEGQNVMYVYAPQTDNVRRVATHARRQGFLGSDISYDDMAQVDLAASYDAKLDGEDAQGAWLVLSPKAGTDVGWEKLRARVNKQHLMVDLIEYFEGGTKKKTQARTEHAVLAGAPTYRKVVFTDHATKHKTELYMESQAIGEDIPDSTFKQRNLVRGG